jgi:hypothetical protein
LLRRWITAGALVAILLPVGACRLVQRLPGPQACTMIGCGTSLEVRLVGEHVPTDFSMTIASPEGNVVHVRCTEGTALFDPPDAVRWTPACPAGGVTFQDFTPGQFTITVRWAEGEAAQEYEPSYSESRPNGPRCEPACHSARVEVQIPEVPAYGDPLTWKTYVDEGHGFRLKYPSAWDIESVGPVNGFLVVFIGDKIQVRTSDDDPLVCRHDCPMIESVETVSMAGREGRQVRGTMGPIHGGVSQHFLMYLFRVGATHVSFVLFAEGRDATADDTGIIRPLQEADIELFQRIMQTLEIGK